MRYVTRLAIIFVIVFMIAFYFFYIQKIRTPEIVMPIIDNTFPMNTDTNVSTLVDIAKSSLIETSLTYSNFVNKSHIQAYKKQIENEYRTMLTETEEDQKRLLEEFPNSDTQYIYKVAAKMKEVGEYENIEIDSYTNTGGAHGRLETKTINFKNTKPLSLTAYLNELNLSPDRFIDSLKTKLKEDNIDESNIKNVTFKSIDKWLIEGQTTAKPFGIRVIFSEYEIASYARGKLSYSL